MKIVHIATRLNVGGVTRHVAWLVSGIQAAGHECHLIAGSIPPGEDDMSYYVREHNINLSYLPEMSRELSSKDFVAVWKLYRQLLRLRPDIIDTHTTKAGFIGRAAGLLYRWLTPATLIGKPRECRLVHTYHGHVYHSFFKPLKSKLFLFAEKALARFTDRIIVVSPLQFEEVHEKFGVGRTKQFRIIGYGVNTDEAVEWSARRRKFRERIAASDNDMVVGFAARLTEIKNPSMFLRVVADYIGQVGGNAADQDQDASAKARPTRFVVIGDGHLRDKLEQEARDLGIENEVQFLGAFDDPEDYYPGLDIVAMTSLNEGMPLTLLESMANKRVTIATPAGGIPDLYGAATGHLEREPSGASYKVCDRGVLIDREDVPGYCAGLRHLVRDEELCARLRANAYSFVQKNHSKERMVMDTLSLYRELIPETVFAVPARVREMP